MLRTIVMTALVLAMLSTAAFAQPAIPAPTPTEPAGEVTSLFSNAYVNQTVTTWSADWDAADVADIQIQGDDTKLYTNLSFAGIEFANPVIDVSSAGFFHLDIWTPEPTDGGQTFKVKLVDFGPDGVYGGGDDSEHELTFTSADGLATGEWVSFDIPMDDFFGLTNRSSMAQLILSGGLPTVYVDNIYWHGVDSGVDPVPTEPAPMPEQDAEAVISLFSDAYDNVLVDSWSTAWDMADLQDFEITGDAVKLYTNTIFIGIELLAEPVDASTMTHFRLDIWTPHATDPPAVFKVKLVDFGPDGAYDGGDDSEHELTFDATTEPALASEQWVSFDIPLDDFTNLAGRSAIAQIILVSDPGPNTLYIDNVYFYNEALSVEEPVAAQPLKAELVSVYPNPFNPSATVQLRLDRRAEVRVNAYNSLGQVVSTLAAGPLNAGLHRLPFEGASLAAGAYLIQATVDGVPLASRKVLLVK